MCVCVCVFSSFAVPKGVLNRLQNDGKEKADPVQDDYENYGIEKTNLVNAYREIKYRDGNRLTFDLFGTGDLKDGDIFEMYFVTSILNFQRQFTACKLHNKNSMFRGEILGKYLPEDVEGQGPNFIAPRSGDCTVPGVETKKSEDVKKRETNIVIPALNESQQKAVDAFVSDEKRMIHIVQGSVVVRTLSW